MEKIFCVKDSNGRFEGSISIYSTSLVKTGDWEWAYSSHTYPMSGSLIKENAELKVMKLRELNSLVGYELNWEVVEITEDEYSELQKLQNQKDIEMGISRFLSYHYNSSVEWNKVKKGCVGKNRKAVKDIYKKYKSLMKKMVA